MSKKKNNRDVFICEYCGQEHDGSYGSGRFCGSSCSRRYSQTYISEDSRERQIKALTSPENREKNAKARKEREDKRIAEVIAPKKTKKELKTTSTARIGKLGEYKVATKFAERDIPVYLPMTEAEEADMIAEFGGKLQKVQVKTSNELGGKYNDVIKFKLLNSDHKVSHGQVKMRGKLYDVDKVDYFALYSLPDDEIYLVKNTGDKTCIYLRDNYPDNGQKAKINLSSDYNIDNVLDMIERGLDSNDIIEADYYEVVDDE